jgi:hypothetical protein
MARHCPFLSPDSASSASASAVGAAMQIALPARSDPKPPVSPIYIVLGSL